MNDETLKSRWVQSAQLALDYETCLC